jgi:mannose-1-phosphate guanylyltransferase / mannose-6-phosphate isomerase
MADTSLIIPIILCGGFGSRLWPLSTRNRPKPFLKLFGNRSLFSVTLERCSSSAFDRKPIVIANQDHLHLVEAELAAASLDAEIILEPVQRDSCAAILAGTFAARKREGSPLVLALASDHHIPDIDAFNSAVMAARTDAEQGWIIAFGVKPTYAATTYGYIECGEPLRPSGPHEIRRFVEKPSVDAAQSYIQKGMLWNTGNLLFNTNAMLAEADVHAPDILGQVTRAFSDADHATRNGVVLDKASFGAARRTSIDFAVLEATRKAAVLKVDYDWSDLGTWDAIHAAAQKDENGNAYVGAVTFQASRNSFVHSADRATVAIGVDDLIVVITPDGVLISRKPVGNQIKHIFERAGEIGSLQIPSFCRGQILDDSLRYHVRTIVVAPLAELPVHMPNEPKRFLVVVEGNITLASENSVMIFSANQSLPEDLACTAPRNESCRDVAVLVEIELRP